MTTIKLHYDGWLNLPALLRRQLSIGTGDTLEAEVVDGALVLRLPGSKPHAAVAPATTIPMPAAKYGRPRKVQPETAAPRLRVGGRRAAKPTVG